MFQSTNTIYIKLSNLSPYFRGKHNIIEGTIKQVFINRSALHRLLSNELFHMNSGEI